MIFAKKVIIIVGTAYTSNIAGNTLREIMRFIIKWMFGPVAAVEWGAKLLYFAVELGGSIAWAQFCNKMADKSAYDSNTFFSENLPDFKIAYEKACSFLEVFPDEDMDAIREKAGYKFLQFEPKKSQNKSKEIKKFNNAKFLEVRATYKLILEFRD